MMRKRLIAILHSEEVLELSKAAVAFAGNRAKDTGSERPGIGS